MKHNILRAIIWGTLLTSGAAVAGSSSNNQVTVWTDATSGLPAANGTLRAVRNSPDSTQYIGCSIYAYDTGSTSIVCYAMTATGTYRSCWSSNPEMIRVAQTLNPASYLFFEVNSDGSCDRVISSQVSFNL
jgi:hypothetical protein